MGDHINFLDIPLLYINTQGFTREQEAEVFDEISGYIDPVDYEFIDDALYAREGEYSPDDLADVVKKVIKYLNNNRIKWEGGKSSFIHGDEHGFIVVTNDNIVIGFIDDEGDVEKEYIPLAENRRL